jgi:G patch domain-containing protein 1
MEDTEVADAKLPDFLTGVQPAAGGTAAGAMTASAFRPFANNAEKQKRYEQYLVCLQNGRKDALKLLQPKAMTEWERERERVEFERAAVLYQPMKAVISSRFVSAGSEEDGSTKSGQLLAS